MAAEAFSVQDLVGSTGDLHQGPQGHRTGLPLETLQFVGHQLTHVPPSFQLHPQISTLLQHRRDMVANLHARVDFAFAELLAFGALSLRRPTGGECSDPGKCTLCLGLLA